MKIYTTKTVVIQVGDLKPVRFTDPFKAAEFWARVKEEEWIEQNKEDPKYIITRYRRPEISNALYDDARVRYRKMKRRALAVFRKIMEVNS